jgi:fumarate reductase subunit D
MENENKKSGGVNPLAIISYIGFLCLIPYLSKEKDDFVSFHAKQGLVLFILEIITWAIVRVFPFSWLLMNLFSFAWLVFSIIGIINVVNKQKKELPVVGSLAGKINPVK